MENQLLELIKTRRSCRHYKAEQISDEELNAVLEAGTYAPTGHGKQDPVIVAVQNPELKARLAKMNAVLHRKAEITIKSGIISTREALGSIKKIAVKVRKGK